MYEEKSSRDNSSPKFKRAKDPPEKKQTTILGRNYIAK